MKSFEYGTAVMHHHPTPRILIILWNNSWNQFPQWILFHSTPSEYFIILRSSRLEELQFGFNCNEQFGSDFLKALNPYRGSIALFGWLGVWGGSQGWLLVAANLDEFSDSLAIAVVTNSYNYNSMCFWNTGCSSRRSTAMTVDDAVYGASGKPGIL